MKVSRVFMFSVDVMFPVDVKKGGGIKSSPERRFWKAQGLVRVLEVPVDCSGSSPELKKMEK